MEADPVSLNLVFFSALQITGWWTTCKNQSFLMSSLLSIKLEIYFLARESPLIYALTLCFSKNHSVTILSIPTIPKWGFYFQILGPKFYRKFSFSSWVLHVLPISSSVIWYLSLLCEAKNSSECVILSTILLISNSYVKIFSSELYSDHLFSSLWTRDGFTLVRNIFVSSNIQRTTVHG
jgi:hypothetical protein